MNFRDVNIAFDNSYLKINKQLCRFCGLWPYDSRRNNVMKQFLVFAILIMTLIPHVLGIKIQCGKQAALCSENIAGVAYCIVFIVKYLVPITSREKFQSVYQKIAENWGSIIDTKEKDIMEDFSKFGRLLTVLYFGYLVLAATIFSQLVLVPTLLDYLIPLNHSREKILTTNGEFPFDPYVHYYELYMFYNGIGVLSVTVLISTDATYMVIVCQSLGIFAVVKYRIMKATLEAQDEVSSYKTMVSAVQIQQQALEFLDLIESTYQLAFMCFIFASVVFMSLGALILVEHADNLVDLIRMTLFEFGVMFHIFFISLPGQLVLDSSEDLFVSTYMNYWFNMSEKTKTLLKIIMMRCEKPCYLTAGGFYIMNFQNFGAMIKTTLSYMTIAVFFQ